VRDKLITLFGLSDEDIRSTSMGAGGEDILFSPVAARRMGISVECKSRDRIAVYGYYEQAKENCPTNREAVVVIKQNRAKPLVVVDAEYYFNLLERSTRE
jgi:hypothetical protein